MHDAFLQEILARPDDDAPRLIYADWLEEQGDVRAEFIRIQCALWGMEEYHPDYRRLHARELALLKQHKDAWLGPIRHMTFEARFYRGFVREITVGPQQFLRHWTELFRLAPIQRLNLTRVTDATVLPLVACEGFRRITELRITGDSGGGRLASLLLGSYHLLLIRKLVWRGELDPDAQEVISDLVRDSRLTELTIEQAFLGPRATHQFGIVGQQRALVALDVSSCGIGYGLQHLATSGWLTGLQCLNLSANAIGDGGVRALAASPLPRTLAALDLGRNSLDGSELGRLFQAFDAPRLKSLRLAHNELRPGLLGALPGAETLARLEHLDLGHTGQLDRAGIHGFVATLPLTTLRLAGCQIGDAGLRDLAKSPRLANLRLLDLSNNWLTDAGAEAILESPHLAKLTRLDLRHNRIGRDRQQALRRRYGPGVCTFSR
jgi:uncharacterized protein (TIGR02996 family)